MRIAIVAGPYLAVPPEKYGGTEQVIYHLVKGLVESGHEPILFGAADSKVDCQLIPITEKPIYFPVTRSDIEQYQKLRKKIAADTAKKLKKILPSVDIVHLHGFDLEVPSNFPCLTTLHNPINLSDLPRLIKHKDLFYVSVSKNQQIACPDLNYAAAIYNGEDPSDFQVVTKPSDYVCFLGRMDRNKNPHLAIELAIYLGLTIKLAGKIDQDGVDYFDQTIKPYLGHPLVQWLGEIDKKDKIDLLSRAKCNLHPTNFREPFGLTVIEAAYCGTPTLAINRGAMPEIIEHGRTGILVEDFTEGYYQLKKCFAMDRSYIADQARLRFNYQKMTEQYLKAYQKVINAYQS